MAASARMVRRRPRWLNRLLTGMVIFLVLCVVGTGTAYVYLRYQLGRIDRLDIPGLSDDGGDVMNVLLVGSDSREGTEGQLAEATGKGEEGTAGQRSDTMMVLHIDPRQQKAAILSIPRDLLVPIAGTDYKDKINTAYALGGATQLIETIQKSLGIGINHYVEVDFVGFERLVNTVGGVKIYVDAPARDAYTGLDIPQAGCVQLDGFQALAYVRSRHYESYEGGYWSEDPSADLGRIERQQDFIRRMMKKAVSTGLTNPITLNKLVGIGVDNVRLDRGMSTKDITTVARRFRSLNPDTVDMQTLPTVGGSYGDAAVQLLNEEEARPLIDRINGAGLEGPVRPAEIQVRVLNGNGSEGAAGKAAFALQGAGFAVAGSGDADAFSYRQTVIRYAPGGIDKAELLKSYLQSGATLEQDSMLGTVDLALVVGADYTGVRPGPSAGAPSPAAPDAAPASPESKPDPKGANQPAC